MAKKTVRRGGMKRTADSRALTKRSKKARRELVVVPPQEAQLCYNFRDGGCISSVIKTLLACREDCALLFTRTSISLSRSNRTKTLLVSAEWDAARLLIKGDPEDVPAEGFSFGFDVKEFHSLASRALTKNDNFLLYFKDDDRAMFVEHVSHKGTGISRNEMCFYNREARAQPLTRAIIGEKGNPNVRVRADEFFAQLNALVVTKCHSVNFSCTSEQLALTGKNRELRAFKTVWFQTTRSVPAQDGVDMTVPIKQLKLLLQARNIARPRSYVRIFYGRHSGVLLVLCDMGPENAPYGYFKVFLKEDTAPTSQACD